MIAVQAIDPGALETLFAEIARYLAAVDAFRGEGCAPRWQAEVLR